MGSWQGNVRARPVTVQAGLPVYFADPHSPWQGGTNENTNGRLRQYFPKGTALFRWSVEDITAVAATLNSRPAEVLADHLRSIPSTGVASTD